MQDIFETQRKCLRLMGHTLENEKSPLLRKWNSFIYYGSLLLVLSAQWPMINYVVYNIDDLTLATASLSIVLTNMLTVIKMITFLMYKQRFMELMEQFGEMFNAAHVSEVKRGLTVANKIAMKLVKLYYFSVSSTGLYFMIGPLVKIIWSKINHKTIIRDLPMPMRFNFDFVSTPGYEFGYVYTGFVTMTVVMYASAIDGLFLSFTINLRSHFQALQFFIQTNKFRRSDKAAQYDISKYIDYHVLLLDLSNKVRQIYKPIVFGQFLLTSVQVCVIIYQLVTHLDTLLVLVVYCTFLAAILLQLFIYCYGGEILKVESSMVGVSVQLSNWYLLTPKTRRMLLLVMLRSQREVVIKAGFYEASLANFMVILRAAMSLITLIQSID
ncbi:odorant receptor 82a-like [Teleopsis dalmanni]|uniref:odorant receptor 82a-like n=1 Tax=Teleopsis dalmanni TaxID=139649 RepID=UPI0018CD7FDC|nr:odorant receptor 82a-like [Teleopsis dalmanni]